MEKVWRIIDIIEWSDSFLKKKQFHNPRSEIEWLLCSVLKCNRLDLYLKYDEPLSKKELSILRNWIKRRLDNEPLQYITGSCDFYGREFLVNPSVLIPRPETERLIDISLNYMKKIKNPKILDIGSGSGCIAITLGLEIKDATIIGIDNSSSAINLAKNNCHLIKPKKVKFIKMDILNKIPKEKFDLIISNPPYIAKDDMVSLKSEVKDFEPEVALTDYDDGLIFYKRFSKIFSAISNDKSFFIMEVGINDHPNNVASVFTDEGYDKIKFFNDYNGDKRVLLVEN